MKKIFLVLLVLVFSISFIYEAQARTGRPGRTTTRSRRSGGGRGNYGAQPTELYKGGSPCKVGSDIHEIDSKFCGYYDYEADSKDGAEEQAR